MYYFTGWSNGVKSENAPLLSSAPAFSVTAQYFRSVVPTAYSLLALSDGQAPVGGLRFNVSSRALGENLALTTDSQGEADFILPNASSFVVSVPELYQPTGQTRCSLLSFDNSTRNVANVTATTIEAAYAAYYQFEVASPIGNTTGSGWYRSGLTATYSVDETSSGGPLVFQRFSGWAGSFLNASTILTIPSSTSFEVILTAKSGPGLVVYLLRVREPGELQERPGVPLVVLLGVGGLHSLPGEDHLILFEVRHRSHPDNSGTDLTR